MQLDPTATSQKLAHRSGWPGILVPAGVCAGVLVGGILGFAFGPAVAGGLAYAWSEWLIPSFMTVYLSGIALCG